ncbi:YppG family protein [Bacillus sp. LL01]|uniref:YppG family protein n=1 Tax=Bacillus sp. LL01 TaxID=1665556 RepID=UPI00069D7A6C|nr:YppG family protein [Bacillus sp. LL01]
MFRRMYGRPRHLSYNRNMSFLNQLPFLNNFLPNANGGGMQGVIPQQFMDGGWMNQQGTTPNNFMNTMPFSGGNMPSSGFPFNMMNQMGQNAFPPNMQMGGGGQNVFQQGMQMGGMGQNGFPQGMQMPGMAQGTNGGGMPNPMGMPFMNPYPTQTQSAKPQTSQVNSFMNQFKGQDGNVDMKKMMDTAGQMMNTVNQLNNMFKGITATFKA